ncbi:insecticidal toxin complex protein TccB1 [Serratia sp. FS14]|uniref:Tc toxin subunit A-related protein n=1 Tax=Serratia sp. (strain FS14) TaxID=1327989 RepID=UPI0004997C0C|nr:Tc toxin subunit A [Serratia sp. FS14]AIA46919.1 insecticidal toxin complex protein TccB1 [Serratia sp. FS14]
MSVITKDFARFPFEGDIKIALNQLGFSSVYDILNLEFTRFYQQYDLPLNGNAVAIYQQAKDFVTLADQQLRRSDGASESAVTAAQADPQSVEGASFDGSGTVSFIDSGVLGDGSVSQTNVSTGKPAALTAAQKAQLARYQQPLYERLFTDDQTRFAPPGSLQSLDSPVSYLVYLLTLLSRMRHPGSSALQDLLARRPDLSTLLLNEDAFKRALPTSTLAGEILQNALTTLTGEEKDIAGWLAFQPYPLTLPFDVARSRIDRVLSDASLTLGEAWSTLSADYRQYGDKSTPALMWSGINAGLQQLLTQSLNNQQQAYPPFFLLINEQGQPVGEHALELGLLWPGYKIDTLHVEDSVNIECISGAKKITLTKLNFEPHVGTPDTLSLQSAAIDNTTTTNIEENLVYRATVSLTVTAHARGQALEQRHIQVGILLGKNLSLHQAMPAAFATEQANINLILGTEIGSITGAQMTIPVDMLCQALGITPQQLQEAFAQGNYAPGRSPWIQWNSNASSVTSSLATYLPVNGGIYGARLLWGTPAWLVGNEPGQVKDDELNTTPFQLDRLQKLVHLQQVSGLPYDQLDNLLQNAMDAEKNAQDISLKTLAVLGVYQRYSQAYHLDIEQVAALFGLIPYCARTGKTPLLDRLLAVGRHDDAVAQQAAPFPLISQDPLNEPKELSLLATAFDTTVDTLTLLINTYKIYGYSVCRSLEGITALYRPVILAKSFSLSVENLLVLLEQIGDKSKYQARLRLLAQPHITTQGGDADSIDLFITLDEAVRWSQQKTRDLNAFMVLLHEDTEKTAAFGSAFIEQWKALSLPEARLKKTELNEQLKTLNKVPSPEELTAILKACVDIIQPSELISNLKNATNEQQTTIASQALAPLVNLCSQHLHVEPGVALSLLFNYAAVLDPLAVRLKQAMVALFEPLAARCQQTAEAALASLDAKIKAAVQAGGTGPQAEADRKAAIATMHNLLAEKSESLFTTQQVDASALAVDPTVLLKDGQLLTELQPLLLAGNVFSGAHIDTVALTPWCQGKLLLNTHTFSLWQQTLWLYDFIDLAQGDERARPVVLAEAPNWSVRLAKGYATDVVTVKNIMGPDYGILGHHRLQRMADFSRASGWGVTDVDELLTLKKIDRSNWPAYLALSLRAGSKQEADIATLATQLGEKRNRALLAAYKSQCRRLTIVDENKQWENAWLEHEPTTADVADQLLIDPEITAKVPTTRITEATASVQAYIQRIADGRHPEWSMTEGELKNWNENDRYYAIWAANQQLRWHPDQYISPIARLKKTPPFKAFENQLSQARLDKDSINDALSSYLTLFEEVVNLSTIGAYQDGLSSTQSTLYFLGRSPHAPFNYYYRTWGKDSSGLRLWSSWQKINLPTTQNVLTQAPPGAEWNNYRRQQNDRNWIPIQARLLIFAGRVSFIWVETRTLTESVQESPQDAGQAKPQTVAEKRYQHVISLVYQRLNGEWSSPIELYKGPPCSPGVQKKSTEVLEPDSPVLKPNDFAKESNDYIDPLPHLSAFVLPSEVAKKNLASIKYGGGAHPYYQNMTVTSDLLAVGLHCTFSNPKQNNASSKLWLFDEDLQGVLPMSRWEKLSDQATYAGLDIIARQNSDGGAVLDTIRDLARNSYYYTPAKKATEEGNPFYFTHILTPCIPEHWLFNQRQVESRSEPVFGTELNLTLAVEGAGQPGLDSYQTCSMLRLTAEQWQHMPADAKLVHFLCVKGKTERHVVTSTDSTLSVSTRYPASKLDSGEVRHGVVLVAKAASDVVSMQPADNAWIESGQLAVLHQPLTSLAAEIRETVQGVQYLYMNDIDQPDRLNLPVHTIHGRGDSTLHQHTTAVAQVYNTLVIGFTTPDQIAVDTLTKEDDWMPLTFVKGENDAALSQWTFDIPREQSVAAVWLVTKVDSQPIRQALHNGPSLPSNVSAWQISAGKLVSRASPQVIEVGEPLYLFTPITVKPGDHPFSCPCPIVTQVDNPLFTTLTFTFYPVSKVVTAGSIITLKNTKLRIVSQQELDEALKSLPTTQLFTQANWGWISPDFLTASQPRQLNRTYCLQSSACHYLLLKIDSKAFKEDDKFSISVQSMLNMSTKPNGRVIGLKAGKAEAITTGEFTYQSQNNTLTFARQGKALNEWLKAYSCFFFVLPWTANAMGDVANYGLRFQLAGLKNTPLSGLIPCDVPTLSDAVIISSCTPGQAAAGDTVTIQAEIKLGSTMDHAVKVEVALNAAYQWAPGVATLAGVQINNNGTLQLTLPAGQRTASLTLAVRVLNVPGNVLPLATLTLTDNYSARRVMLEQPQIAREHAVAIEWDWYFGADNKHLTKSSALREITGVQLESAVVLNTLHIMPSSLSTPITASLYLPAGVTIAKDAAKILQELKVANGGKKAATKEQQEWLAGIELMMAFLNITPPPTGGLLTLFKNVVLKQSVVLPLPLKVDTTKKFIDSLTATVKFGPAQEDVWLRRSYPILWATDDTATLAVSASSSQPYVIETKQPPTEQNQMSCRFGDSVKLTLSMVAMQQASTVKEVSLMLPPNLSYQRGAIQGRLLSSAERVAVSLPAPVQTAETPAQITIPLSLTLQPGERYQLDVTVAAIPQHTVAADSGIVQFSVKIGFGNSEKTVAANPLYMAQLYLPSQASVVPQFNDGRLIPAGTALQIGTHFNYHISFAMDSATLQQLIGIGQQLPIPGPQLLFMIPSTLKFVVEKNTALTTTLPLLTKTQSEQANVGSSKKIQNYGLHVVSGDSVYAQTVINSHSDIKGEFTVPVTVVKEGVIIPTLTVNAINGNLTTSSVLQSYRNPAYQPPRLSAYDSDRLPFSDLQFRRSGREGFDLPLPENIPPVLANKYDGPPPVVARCVRLNTQFGQALVRTARYNPLAILRAAMQDHPLPPLPSENAAQPLVCDIANQLYFWELFYHVPALVAFKLNQDGRYEEAQEWLHYLFYPVVSKQEWHPAAFWRCRLLTTLYSYVSLDQATGPVDPDVIASVRPEFYQRATFFAYVKNLLDNGDSYYRSQSRDGFNKAWQCYLKVSHLLGAGEQQSQVAAWNPLTVDQAIKVLGSSGVPDRLFALPRSHVYQDLVDKLQQRVFNMRNGLTLDGSPLSLPLYDPAQDPAQLLAARAAGSAASIRALAMQSHMPLPVFRYSTLYARASAAVDTLIQFGSSLLTYLNGQKEIEYQSLLINQQQEMSNFVIGQQQLAVQMNQQARQGLVIARNASEKRLNDLTSRIEKEISDQESLALSLRLASTAIGFGISAANTAGAALDVVPNIFGFSNGGMRWGAIPRAVAEALMTAANGMDAAAFQIETREMYRRRSEEWQLQRDDAQASLQQLDVQLEVDTWQQQNLERQLAQSRAQSRQFEQQLSFISTRFTNQHLYQWLVGQLSSLYYQVYDIAAGLCQQAVTAWQYEVGNYSEQSTQFFKNSGWSDAHRGLLSGEHLRLGLLQLDKAYLDQTARMLEIRHTVSLKSLWQKQRTGAVQQAADAAEKAATAESKTPEQKAAAIKGAREKAADGLWNTAVQQQGIVDAELSESLKINKGNTEWHIPIPVTEDLFVERYPGHYQRQVIDVSVTLPCLIGPHEEVCAMLTQQNNRFAIDPSVTYQQMTERTPAPQVSKIWASSRPQQAIALSSGLEDNGIVLNFNDDKYRPFEGNGVVGTWYLTIPNPQGELQQRMLASLNDIILTFHYRAKDGGTERATRVLKELHSQKPAINT